jgi:DNA-binding transcriptional regulator YhcF (GntR family)
VELTMNEQFPIPDEETRKRLLKKLRQGILDLQEFGFQLEEVQAGLDKHIREQKMKRLETRRENYNKVV